tara:strand:+ start:4695 stop:5591 length:897 start_codon:yes stop_codon:yes gene_type:complete
MKKWFLTLLITFFFNLSFSKNTALLIPTQKENKTQYTIIVDSIERVYYIYLPKNLPANAPLVMVFHGYSGDALNTQQTTKFNQLADQNGFAVCYPQGLIDRKKNAFWQVGYSFHKDFKVDDVKFVSKLVQKLQTKFKLSRKNVFMTGFSNGGDFCNLLSCEREGLFNAAAPIVSCFMEEFFSKCQMAKPIPTFMLNGTEDPITFWNGDMENTQGYGPYLPTQAMLNFRLQQIQYENVIRDTIRSPDLNENTLIAIEKYSSALSNNQIWMYSYLKGGHGYPNYLNLEEEIWNFFELYLD